MPKIVFDAIRWALILTATGLSVRYLWTVNRIAGVVLALPAFVLFLNLFGFLTLRLYDHTLEARKAREFFGSLQTGEAPTLKKPGDHR
ncbi:MAG: hypothetical protein ABFE13_09425 [Phycisphaerales bacterium]